MAVPTDCRRPTVTAVVLAWGDEPLLEESVRAVLASEDVEADVVLVDNGCTSDAVEVLSSVAGVTVVRPGRNLGFAAGCNLGARQADRRVRGLRQRRRRGALRRAGQAGRRACPTTSASPPPRCGSTTSRTRSTRPATRCTTSGSAGPAGWASPRRRTSAARTVPRTSPPPRARRPSPGPTGSPRSAGSASRCSPTARTPTSACAAGSAAGAWSGPGRGRPAPLRVQPQPAEAVPPRAQPPAHGAHRLLRTPARRGAGPASWPWSWRCSRWRPRTAGRGRKVAGWWWLLRHAGLVRRRRREVQAARVVTDARLVRLLTGDVTPGVDGLSVPTMLRRVSVAYWALARRAVR